MSLRCLAGMALMTLLTGCASQSVHYYSLLPTAAVLEQPAQQHSVQASKTAYAVSVQAVGVPPQVDRPQIVFMQSDSAQLIPLSSALWASPLPEQIRVAFADELSDQLGVLDVAASAAAYKIPLWKVNLSVHRFESVYQQRAVLDVSWQLTPVNITGSVTHLCGAQIQIPVQDTVSSMVQGHQQAIKEMAQLVASQLKGQPFPAESNRLHLKGCTSG